MELLRKSNTASAVVFPLVSLAARPDFKSGATFEAGDVKVIRHTGGAWNVANIGTLPVEISTTGNYYIPLTATELNPDDTKYPVIVKIVDQTSPKVWDDTEIIVSFTRSDDIATLLTDTGLIKGYTDTLETVLGSPAGASMSADIAAIKADCVTIKGYTDSVEGSLATALADLVMIKGYTDTLESVLGTPAGVSVSADVAAVKSDCVLIKGYTDTVEASLTTALSNLSTLLSDTSLIKGYTDTVEASLTTALADLVTLKADCVTIKGYTDSLEGSLTTALADLVMIKGYTDTLEVSATTLLSDTSTLKSDTTTLKADTTLIKGDTTAIVNKLPITGLIAGQNDVLNIQNNTFLSMGIPASAIIPSVPSSSKIVPITIQLRDEIGNPEDPDNNEISIQARFVNAGAYSSQFYNNEAGSVAATASTIFTPSYYKTIKDSTGVYKLYFKLRDTDQPDFILFTIAYKEGGVTNIYTRSMTISYDAIGNAVLSDSVENRTIIAKALKNIDVSATAVETGSIMAKLVADLTFLIGKMPSGTVSDFGKTTLIDGTTVEMILQLIMAMVDGKIIKDSPEAGDLTIFKRDGTTVLTVTRSTDSERNRVSL